MNNNKTTKEELDISGIHFDLIERFKLSGVCRACSKSRDSFIFFIYRDGVIIEQGFEHPK